MKRLALLAVATMMAVLLSACGERADKKDTNAANTTEQSQQNSLDDAAKDADSKLQQPDTTTTPTTPSDSNTQTGQ